MIVVEYRKRIIFVLLETSEIRLTGFTFVSEAAFFYLLCLSSVLYLESRGRRQDGAPQESPSRDPFFLVYLLALRRIPGPNHAGRSGLGCLRTGRGLGIARRRRVPFPRQNLLANFARLVSVVSLFFLYFCYRIHATVGVVGSGG